MFEHLDIKKATIVSATGTSRLVADNTADLALRVIDYIGKSRLTGFEDRDSKRDELQGGPRFKGVSGPMWNGDGWLYEAPRTRLHDE